MALGFLLLGWAVCAPLACGQEVAAALDTLRQLTHCPPAVREALLAQLDDEQFAVREAATQRLLQLATIPRAAWSAQLATAPAERRWRLRLVLDRHEAESSAAMRRIQETLTAGAAELTSQQWLTAAALLERAEVRDEFSRLLSEHVKPEQLPPFRAAVDSDQRSARLAAALVLSRSRADDDVALVDRLLRDRDDEVAMRAALGRAQQGDARAIPTLVRLLDAESLDIRQTSATWLTSLTGQEFDYSPTASAAERQVAMAQWRAWHHQRGATLAMQPPLRVAVHGRGPLAGLTLVATGALGKVFELDSHGNVVWQVSAQAWSAEKLPSGNVLVASHWENRVCEFDRQGQVVWELPDVNAVRAKPLSGGRVLIADLTGNRVLEVDRQGRIIWQQATPNQCFDAERLHNGHTLFACPNLIGEITPTGDSVRQWPVEGRVNSLQVLPSGRLLVANYGLGCVSELDDQNRIVWEHKIARPSDAFRLPGGRTLIATAQEIVEVDLQGRQIRHISAAVNGCARQ
jgi:hypothetical protein